MTDRHQTLYLMGGISATGKGTRNSTLLEFLKTKYTCKSLIAKKENGKGNLQIAVLFPEIKLAFFGRWVKSNLSGLISFSSLDSYSSYKDTLYTKLFNKLHDNGYSMLAEGYFGFKDVAEDDNICGKYRIIYTNIFLYDDIEDLQQRCLIRSGKRIKGTCYQDNNSMLKPEFREKYRNKLKSTHPNSEVLVSFKSFNEDASNWGVRVLLNEGLDHLVNDFQSWSKDNATYRNINDKEGNFNRFSKYLDGDSKETEDWGLELEKAPDKDLSKLELGKMMRFTCVDGTKFDAAVIEEIKIPDAKFCKYKLSPDICGDVERTKIGKLNANKYQDKDIFSYEEIA